MRSSAATFGSHQSHPGRLLSALREEQPVVCHAHGFSNASLLFALSACDRVWLSPAGEVATVGIAGQMLYLQRPLDRLKVKADFLHMGRYKSAAETFTEDGPTAPAREYGPWSAEAAVQAGLVGAVGYLSDAREDAKERARADSGPARRASRSS